MADLSSQVPLLMVLARSRRCAFPLGDVIETMRPLPISPVAHAPAFVLGVAVIRAQPTAVIDLGVLLGLGEPAAPARFVTVRAGPRTVAIQVEAVEGVRRVDPGLLQAPAALLRSARADHVASLAAIGGDLLAVLDGARIISDEVWAALDGDPGGRPADQEFLRDRSCPPPGRPMDQT